MASLSSREALARSLELAQIAVRLDTQSDDPGGAIVAYARSVALLDHVVNAAANGVSGRRRPAAVARRKQDEIERVKAIHETYSQRMRLLSEIYSIPVVRLTPQEAFSGRANVHARL